MINIEDIDQKIWIKDYEQEGGALYNLIIYHHVKNFGNNGDKFLIVLSAEQSFFIPNINDSYFYRKNTINDEDYDLKKLEEKETIAFVVCGNWELSELIYGFSNFYKRESQDVDTGSD